MDLNLNIFLPRFLYMMYIECGPSVCPLFFMVFWLMRHGVRVLYLSGCKMRNLLFFFFFLLKWPLIAHNIKNLPCRDYVGN